MRHLIALTLLSFISATAAMAQVPLAPASTVKETLDIGTSTSEIAITSDFRGADLTVFGALNGVDDLLLQIGQYDIVVTLEGPKDLATVRKKERVFGIWMNTRALTFDHVPESYSMASTRDLDTVIGRPQSLSDLGVGIDYMALSPTGNVGNGTGLTEFRDAFRRLKVSSGLYQRDLSGVRFISSSLFRATLRLPANVPDGVHMVKAYLFKSGDFVTQRSLPLRVTKTGLEQAITDAAHEQPLAYGVLCVFLAIVTGWGASIIFRRD